MFKFKSLVNEIDLEGYGIAVVSSTGKEFEVGDFASTIGIEAFTVIV